MSSYSYITTRFLTHRQKVCKLYKAAIRNIKSTTPDRAEFRYEACVMRARFDKNKDIKDPLVASKLLADGEKEFFRIQHPDQLQFAISPGGITYGRELPSQDWVMDQWHPMEMAQYPDYFKRRFQMKKEYIEWYKKKYGITDYNPNQEGHPHLAWDSHDYDEFTPEYEKKHDDSIEVAVKDPTQPTPSLKKHY